MNVINWNIETFRDAEGSLPENVDIFRIRMDTPLDKNYITPPVATVTTTTGTYTDSTATDGVRYRYHIVPEGRYVYSDNTLSNEGIIETFTFTIDV